MRHMYITLCSQCPYVVELTLYTSYTVTIVSHSRWRRVLYSVDRPVMSPVSILIKPACHGLTVTERCVSTTRHCKA